MFVNKKVILSSFHLRYIVANLASQNLDVINLFANWNENKQPFIPLADQIPELKKEDGNTQALENEIGTLVYRLYDLTDEKIAIVEGMGK